MRDSASDDIYEPWKLLQSGDFADAVAIFRDRCSSTRGPGRKRGLGEGLMWAGDYSTAADHFRDAIARDAKHQGYNASNEEDFAFLGAAEWCSEDYEAAIKAWSEGIKAIGSIGGGRTHCPLLLLLSSILRPQLYRRERAERILLILFKRLNSRYAGGWPASEARFAAGLIDEKALEASWPSTPPLNIRLLGPEGEWKRDFYKAARDLAAGIISIEDAKQTWRSLSERSRYGSGEVKDFYSIISTPEFFIADHECTRSPEIEIPIG
jgi:hypothetical protein